jgi:hypothetical protein
MRGINAARELVARLDASLVGPLGDADEPHESPAEDEELA